MSDKLNEIKKEFSQLKPFIDEQLFQLLANGHTKEQAKNLILNELKQNVLIVETFKQ